MSRLRKVVMVTGGAGYIGSHVCKALARQGYIPVAVDSLISGNEEAVKWGPFERADIRDRARLDKIIRQYDPYAIMHFAGLIQVGDSVQNPAEFYDYNVTGTLRLLEAARASGIKKFIFSSTAAVYGAAGESLLTEKSELNPINPYGRTKLAAEKMIMDFSAAYGMDYAILRYFNAAGADPETETGTAYKKDTHLIPLLMRVCAGVMPEIKVFGTDYDTPDGTAVRDYIHVSDLADAHIRALDYIRKKSKNLTLNLGTSAGHSVLEVLKTTRQVTGHPVPATLEARRPGDPPVLVADAFYARRLLSWTPVYSDLKTIIETAWAWKRAQQGLSAVSSQDNLVYREVA